MTLYHGGRARVAPSGLITAGRRPNPWGDTFDDHGRSIFVYASEDLETAVAYAEAIKRLGRRAYVYEVEPTGEIFGSGAEIRTRDPLRVIKRIT